MNTTVIEDNDRNSYPSVEDPNQLSLFDEEKADPMPTRAEPIRVLPVAVAKRFDTVGLMWGAWLAAIALFTIVFIDNAYKVVVAHAAHPSIPSVVLLGVAELILIIQVLIMKKRYSLSVALLCVLCFVIIFVSGAVY